MFRYLTLPVRFAGKFRSGNHCVAAPGTRLTRGESPTAPTPAQANAIPRLPKSFLRETARRPTLVNRRLLENEFCLRFVNL
jgi:hypothetical protein